MCAACVCRLFGFVFPACDQKQQQQQRGKQLFTCLMYEAEGSGKAVSMCTYTYSSAAVDSPIYACGLSDVNSASTASCIHVERTAVHIYTMYGNCLIMYVRIYVIVV